MSNRDSTSVRPNPVIIFNTSVNDRQSTMGAEIDDSFSPGFESRMRLSKLDAKEPPAVRGNTAVRQGKNDSHHAPTSFFLKAIEKEQREQNRRDEKLAMIDALKAELDQTAS